MISVIKIILVDSTERMFPETKIISMVTTTDMMRAYKMEDVDTGPITADITIITPSMTMTLGSDLILFGITRGEEVGTSDTIRGMAGM